MCREIRTLADIEGVVIAHLAAQGIHVERTEPIGRHRLRVVNGVAEIRVIGPGSVPRSLDVEAVSRRGTQPAALFAVEFPNAVDLEASDAGVALYKVDREDGTVTSFAQAVRAREQVASIALSVDARSMTRDLILAIATQRRPQVAVAIGSGPIDRTYRFEPTTKAIVVADGAVAWRDDCGFTCVDLASGTTFTDMGEPATIEGGVLLSGYGLMVGDGYGWAAGYRIATGEQLWKNATDPLLAGSWMSAVASCGVAAVPLARLPSPDQFAIAGFELDTGECLWWLDVGQPGFVVAQHDTLILGEVLDGRLPMRFFDVRTGEQRGHWTPAERHRTGWDDPDAGLMWWMAEVPNDDGTDTIWCIDSRDGALLETLRLPGTPRSVDAGQIFWQEGEQLLRRRPGAPAEVLARGFHLSDSGKGYTIGTSGYGVAAWNSATGARTMEARLEQLFPAGWRGNLDADLIKIHGTDLIVAQEGVLAVVDLRDGSIRQHEALETMAKIDGVTEADGYRWVILSDRGRGVIVPIVASIGNEFDEVLGLLDGVTASLHAPKPRPELGRGDRW